MKNAESFIVWTGNVYGDWDRCLDIWTNVSEAEAIGKAVSYTHLTLPTNSLV